MSDKSAIASMLLALALSASGAVFAVSPTPSTNDANKTLGWAHVNQLDVGIGYVTLEFISTRAFYSCFEVRTDGDTSQVLAENGGANYNTLILDGLYPYYCTNNSTVVKTIFADEYVDVRMVFGAESDERFDWTPFDVLPDAKTKEDCKGQGWKAFGFKNQGQCVRFVENGKDSR